MLRICFACLPAPRLGAALQLQLELAGVPGPSGGAAQAASAAAAGSSQDLSARHVLVAALCIVTPGNGTQVCSSSQMLHFPGAHAACMLAWPLPALPACNAHLVAAHTPTLFSPALQAYIPVSARAVRLPRELHARVSLCLPLGAARPAAGLAVVLLHPFPGDPRWRYRYHLGAEERRRWDAAQAVAAEAQRVQPPECGQLALLASLASAPHRLGSSSVAAGYVGATAGSGEGSDSEGRLLEPRITAAAAFTLLPSGSQVGYSIIPLDGLLGGSSKAEVSEAGGTWLGSAGGHSLPGRL